MSFRLACLLAGLVTGTSCRIFRGKETLSAPPTPRVIRPDRIPSLTGFEQLAGWTVSCPQAPVRLDKEGDGALWGAYAARLSVEPKRAGDHVVTLVPARELVVNSVFNTVLLWVREETPGLLRPDHRIVLRVRDASGIGRDIALPYQPRPGWQMLHLRFEESPPWPLTVEHLRWEFPVREAQPASRVLFLDALACYQEILTRIPQDTHYVRPFDYAPPYARAGSGSVLLDFPAVARAFLPRSASPRQRLAVESGRERQFVLRAEGQDGTVEYLVDAEDAGPRVRVRWNGREWPGLWSGPRVESAREPLAFRLARRQDDAVLLQYSDGVRFRVTLAGRTLVLEAESVGGDVAAMDLGVLGFDPTLPGQPIQFPLMNPGTGQTWPVMLFLDRGESLFVSCFPDWWASLAGGYQAGRNAEGEGEALGCMEYPPRWRGSRNVFRERVYLTVSPRVEDVLPSPSLRPALYREQGRGLLWSDIWPLAGTPAVPAGPGRVAAWTGDALAPAGTWPHAWRSQGGLAAPRISLTDLHPLDAEWKDSHLARSPLGAWIEHPADGYVLKSARFPDMGVGRVIGLRAAQDTGGLPLGDIVRQGPWRFTDYDARVLGAGTYAQSFSEIGVLLQQAAAEIGGPVIGPGGAEWLYAGLVAGLVPEPTLGFGQTHPFLPLFALSHVQALSSLHGMGALASYRIPGEDWDEARSLDRLLATQIAYAACGRMPVVEEPRLRQRAGALLPSLHRLLDAERFEHIAYWDGEGFIDSSRALAGGVIARSQIYLRGAGGVEIWVNGDFERDWTIRVGDQDWVLPPFGFFVRGDRLVAVHARGLGGHRFYGLRDAGSVWIDSPEGSASFAGLTLAGSGRYVYPVQGKGGRFEIGHWQGEAALSESLPGIPGARTIVALDATGKPFPGATWSPTALGGVLKAGPGLGSAIFPP